MAVVLRTTSGDLAEPSWVFASTQTRSSSPFWKCWRPMMLLKLFCSLPVGLLLNVKKKKKSCFLYMPDFSQNDKFLCCFCSLASWSSPVQAVVCENLVSWTWRPTTMNVWGGTTCLITWSMADWRAWTSGGFWRQRGKKCLCKKNKNPVTTHSANHWHAAVDFIKSQCEFSFYVSFFFILNFSKLFLNILCF